LCITIIVRKDVFLFVKIKQCGGDGKVQLDYDIMVMFRVGRDANSRNR